MSSVQIPGMYSYFTVGDRQLLKTLRRQGRGRAVLKYLQRPSKTFDELLKDEKQRQIFSHFLERLGHVKEKINYEQDTFGTLQSVFSSTYEQHVLTQLHENVEWNEILAVIGIIESSCTYLYYYRVNVRQ